MSELQENIRNLGAVLDLLQAGACAAQQPVLRLAGDHLRLLARCLEPTAGLTPDLASAPLPPTATAVPLPPEVRHAPQ